MLAYALLVQLAFPATKSAPPSTIPQLAAPSSVFRIEPNLGRYAEEVRYVMFTGAGVVLFTDDGMVDSAGIGVVLKDSLNAPLNALGFRRAVRNPARQDSLLYIPLYSKLVRRGVYPGIDAIYEVSPDGALDVSFLLQSGARLSDIAIAFQGAEKIEQAKKGEILLKTIPGNVVQRCPRVMRMTDGRYIALPATLTLYSDGLVRLTSPKRSPAGD